MENENHKIRLGVSYDWFNNSESFHKDRAHAKGANRDYLCFKITKDILECVSNDEGSKLKDVANWLRSPKKSYQILNAPGKETKVFDKIIKEVNIKIAKHNGSGPAGFFRKLFHINYIKPIE